MAESKANQGKGSIWAAIALLVLPVLFLVSALVLREDGGPFWIWHAIDPSYFYLLDSVNLVNLTTPGHVAHPGTPVQAIGALVLWSIHGFADPEVLIEAVLSDPETYLRAISTVLYVLNGVALVAVGFAARAALGGLMPALMVQAGPFVSTVIVRHALYVKPETLLVFASLALAFVTLLALRPGALERRRIGFAVAFGMVAGFGVATKISAAPLYILPVFLLWGARPLAVYAISALAGFILFILPAAGAFDIFLSYFSQIAMGSGHFGMGEQTVIDFAVYPHAVVKLFSRPVLSVPILLSGAALAIAWRRKTRGLDIPALSVRALAGVILAQVLQILVVAKHPSAHYILPTLVLSGLTLALLYDVVAKIGIGSTRVRFWARESTAILFSVFLLAQAAAVVAQDMELREWRAEAGRIDMADFNQCLRVNFQFASDPVYALFLGNYVTRQKLSDRLAVLAPPDAVWFEVVSRTFRDWHGELDMLEALAEYPCAVFRGSERSSMESFLKESTPGVTYHDGCSTPYETILTTGVNCRGELTGQ